MTRRTAFALFGAFSLIRALLAPAIDLMPQSAYYFTYAQHPALSYYDHPPMIGWLLLAGILTLGKSSLAVHATIFVTTLGTQVALYELGRRVLGPELAGRTLAVVTSGGLAVLLSLVAVPDVPLVLFWTLALLALHRALFGDEERDGAPEAAGRPVALGGWGAWLATGTLFGLAFLSKYTALFLQGGLVLYLLASPRHRRLLRTPRPWAALAVAHLVSLPVYVWNWRHDFASFAYQMMGRASESEFDPDDFLGFLGSQALVLLPVPFFAFLWVAGRKLLRAPRAIERLPPRELFLLAFSVPLFLTCVGLSTLTWVKTNWAMPAYVTGLLLAAPALGRRGTRWHLVTGVLLHLVLVVQLVWYPVPVTSNDTWFGWSELAQRVEARLDERPGSFVLALDNYKTTAELRFYSEAPVYGMNVIGWNALQYDYLGEDLGALAGRDALVLRTEEDFEPSAETDRYLDRVRLYFASVREVEPIRLRRRGEVVRLVRVFLAREYAGPGVGAGGGPDATISPP